MSTGDVLQILRHLAPILVEELPDHEGELAQLDESVSAFVDHDPLFSVDHLLVELALGSTGSRPTTAPGVKLATLHKTKGLEWPIVYLVGLEQEVLPSYYSVRDGTIDEARRLCFVGVTRAIDELHLRRSRSVNGWHKEPSQFLAEIGLT